MGSLDGKMALVTGASSGLGEGIALALSAAGATVALSARREDRLNDLAKRIGDAGGNAIVLPGDISDETVAQKTVADAIDRLGRLDILINCAGVNQFGGVEDLPLDEWKRVMDINWLATLACSQTAIPQMKKQGAGDIINISSIAGKRASGLFGPYTASKFAVSAMTEGMRQEVGEAGIRVTNIMPGATESEVAEGITNPQMRESIRQHVTKEGAMKPEDIGDAVVFICSLPRRANVSEILIRPTIDVAPS